MTKLWFAVIALMLVAVFMACGAPTPTPAAPPPPQQAAPKPKAAVTTPAPAATTPAPSRTTPPPPAAKAGEAPYYQGKTIEILVDSAAGGGTDAMARITAPFLTQYIPGNPRVVIRNQSGAGGMIGVTSFQEKAKPDGLALLQHGSGVISMQLASRDMIKYDLTKNRYLGNVSRAESVVLIKKDLKGQLVTSSRPLVAGTKEGQETWQAILMYGKEFLGWNLRWVPGFGGTSEMEIAFRRGELDVFATSNAFIIQRLTVQEGVAETVATIGAYQDGQFSRRSDFPEVPTFAELLGDKKPAGIPWQAFLAFMGPTGVDKALAAPPKTPDNIMAILTGAFGKTAKDPKFDATIKKLVTEAYDVGVGKQTDDMLLQVLEAPPEAIAYTRDLQLKFGIIAKK